MKALGWMNDAERNTGPRSHGWTMPGRLLKAFATSSKTIAASLRRTAEPRGKPEAVKTLEEQITKLKAAISTINVKVQDFNIQSATSPAH
ncbi:hypothetical protein [Agrobacterium sp. T29]|uniref:hypothetical protein n=1 Tax=Agrobacterium sp. T29 TaxID=2580515 RepID=UPI001FEE4E5E|nr:hypothetical protein [Agrobacterium sp. T29]